MWPCYLPTSSPSSYDGINLNNLPFSWSSTFFQWLNEKRSVLWVKESHGMSPKKPWTARWTQIRNVASFWLSAVWSTQMALRLVRLVPYIFNNLPLERHIPRVLKGWWHPVVADKAAMCGWENTPFSTLFSQVACYTPRLSVDLLYQPLLWWHGDMDVKTRFLMQ